MITGQEQTHSLHSWRHFENNIDSLLIRKFRNCSTNLASIQLNIGLCQETYKHTLIIYRERTFTQVLQGLPCWMTTLSNLSFISALSIILSSTVFSVTKRNTLTCFCWPILWARSCKQCTAMWFMYSKTCMASKNSLNKEGTEWSYVNMPCLVSLKIPTMPDTPKWIEAFHRSGNLYLNGGLLSHFLTIMIVGCHFKFINITRNLTVWIGRIH